MANLIYQNSEYDISLYGSGLSAYYECDKCGERLMRTGIEFPANNREASRYKKPKELRKEHKCNG